MKLIVIGMMVPFFLIDAQNRRTSQPWVITMGHRPLYCSNSNKMNCQTFAQVLQSKVEDLFLFTHVDIVVTAHQVTTLLITPLPIIPYHLC
jgi:hypothetical protein